jgi:hypothetical protein
MIGKAAKPISTEFTNAATKFCPALLYQISPRFNNKLVNKTTIVMQLGATVFIIPWKALYMFWVLFTPIIRSVLKLRMCNLVMA